MMRKTLWIFVTLASVYRIEGSIVNVTGYTHTCCGEGIPLNVCEKCCHDGAMNCRDQLDTSPKCQTLGCANRHFTMRRDATVPQSSRILQIRYTESPSFSPPYLLGTLTVFATKDKYVANAFGGLQGADTICNQEAQAAGLSGNYVAWLSDSKVSARQRINPVGGAFVLVDGTIVASNYDDLIDGTLDHSIDQEADGTVITSGIRRVWTGTNEYGGSSGFSETCQDWTVDYGNGRFGDIPDQSQPKYWTNRGVHGCFKPCRFYCIQQPGDAYPVSKAWRISNAVATRNNAWALRGLRFCTDWDCNDWVTGTPFDNGGSPDWGAPESLFDDDYSNFWKSFNGPTVGEAFVGLVLDEAVSIKAVAIRPDNVAYGIDRVSIQYLKIGTKEWVNYTTLTDVPEHSGDISTSWWIAPLSTRPTSQPSIGPTSQPTEGPSASPTSHPTDVPTDVPTDSPTASPTAEICKANIVDECITSFISDTFETHFLVRFDQVIDIDLMARFLSKFQAVYDRVAGSVCDSCRRHILDYELLSTTQEAFSQEDSVLLKVTIGHIGECDTAFDNNDETEASADFLDFVETCGTFVSFGQGASHSCCCASCGSNSIHRRALKSGGISSTEFANRLGDALNVKVVSSQEVNPPKDDGGITCDPAAPQFTSGHLELTLPDNPADYDKFLSLFRTTYNQLCLENCYPQRIVKVTLVEDDATRGDGRVLRRRQRRLGRQKIKIDAVNNSNNKIPVPDKCKLFKRCRRRNLKQMSVWEQDSPVASNLAWREARSDFRHLQLGGTGAADTCLCLAGNDAPEPTFELPTTEEFTEALNEELVAAELEPIEEEDIEDAVPVETTANQTKTEWIVSTKGSTKGTASKSSGKGSKGSKGGKDGKGNKGSKGNGDAFVRSGSTKGSQKKGD